MTTDPANQRESDDEEHTKFKQGDIVKVVGLGAKPEFNGKQAKIVGLFMIDTKRWPIQILDATQEKLAVKTVNLKLCSSTADIDPSLKLKYPENRIRRSGLECLVESGIGL